MWRKSLLLLLLELGSYCFSRLRRSQSLNSSPSVNTSARERSTTVKTKNKRKDPSLVNPEAHRQASPHEETGGHPPSNSLGS